jgi:hypothetical protein
MDPVKETLDLTEDRHHFTCCDCGRPIAKYIMWCEVDGMFGDPNTRINCMYCEQCLLGRMQNFRDKYPNEPTAPIFKVSFWRDM